MKPHGRVPPGRPWPRRAGRRRVVAPLVIALAASACSGDDASPPATSAPVTNPPLPTSPATTAPPTAPTTPPTTDPPLASATSVPATDAAAIADAAVAAWTAWNDVLLDPTDDARLQAVARTHTGDALERVVDTAARWRIENRRSITNPASPAFIEPDPSSVVIDSEAGVATIEYCHLDSNVSVEVGGNQDGSDRVIDETVTIRFEREEFRLVDGHWLKSDGTSLGGDRPGEVTCPG